MTKFFESCKTLDELKKEFRRLAMLNHPDKGGSTATMQEINAEYDRLFPALKLAYNRAAEQPTHETAESTRNQWYTENGWAGRNYDSHMSTKDIAIRIREYVKSAYPDCKFSVTTHYASMCSEISVALTAAPYEALKTENSDHGKGYRQVNYYYIEEDTALTDYAKAVLVDVNDVINSYRYNDSDSMIDYFDTNFYYSLNVGKWDKPFVVNNKQPKITAPKTEQPTSGEQNSAAPEVTRAERTNSMEKLILTYKGRDSWDRPVYEHEGRLLVDVEPRSSRSPEICTKMNNVFDGEPDTPIQYIPRYAGAVLEFKPIRDTW